MTQDETKPQSEHQRQVIQDYASRAAMRRGAYMPEAIWSSMVIEQEDRANEAIAALKEELVKTEDQLSRDEKALRYLADKLNLTFAPTKEGADSLVRDALSALEALRAERGKETK